MKHIWLTNSYLENEMANVNLEPILEMLITKVNAKGVKRKKLKCNPGYHPNPDGTACVVMASSEKRALRIGSIKARRTKKAGGMSLLNRTIKKTRKAMRFRKAMGL